MARLFLSSLALRRIHRVACYWAADGELDPRPLLDRLLRYGRSVWLPVLRPGRRHALDFLRYEPGAPLRRDRLGILEPVAAARHRVSARTLDLVLVPLVGFDPACNRLGMGGGFYDRTLGFLRWRRHWRRPRLIGIAHECQRVERLVPRPWDVPLDAVVTERRIYPKNPI
jgi:5-formyltetrahydrofolate cyclo-ligase